MVRFGFNTVSIIVVKINFAFACITFDIAFKHQVIVVPAVQ